MTMATAQAIERLRAALPGREGHAALVGLYTRPSVHGCIFGWRDYFTGDRGRVATLANTAELLETAGALVAEMQQWRASAERAKRKPAGRQPAAKAKGAAA